jgi:hypothetical protein
MKLFPPNPRNVEAATSYVKRIPRRSGISDYQAIREAGIGPLVVAPMFFVFMATSVDDLTIVAILLSIGFGLFGIFCVVLGYRTLSLLDLFPNTDVPSPLKEKCDTDKSTLKK